jgi:hypothetical protein
MVDSPERATPSQTASHRLLVGLLAATVCSIPLESRAPPRERAAVPVLTVAQLVGNARRVAK